MAAVFWLLWGLGLGAGTFFALLGLGFALEKAKIEIVIHRREPEEEQDSEVK